MGHFGCFGYFGVTHLDTLGAILDPGKAIFGHFIDFGHFPIEIPIEAEKTTDSRRKGRTSKTKTVLKIVDQMEQLETITEFE